MLAHNDLDVLETGAVVLGGLVVCDGFCQGIASRIQTHIHDDHMDDFETSKQFQDVYASKPTRELLIAELNADLEYRTNLIGLDFNSWHEVDGGEIMLLPSGHMLGASQVIVRLPSGQKLGYSGDFQWPLAQTAKVDALVVDSTYGSPSKRREFTQNDANDALVTLVSRQLKRGPLHLKAFRGTIQRALEVLAGEINAAIIASPRLYRDLEVHRAFGRMFDPVFELGSEDALNAMKSGRYIRLYSKGDRFSDNVGGTRIVLSAYMSANNDPVNRWNEHSFTVALTDHADYFGTIEYVRASGAQFVVTDNTRGHGVELALALQAELGIKAVPSTNAVVHLWA